MLYFKNVENCKRVKHALLLTLQDNSLEILTEPKSSDSISNEAAIIAVAAASASAADASKDIVSFHTVT